MITLSNAKEMMRKGGVIQLEPIYEVKKRRWWFISLPPFKMWKVLKPIDVELSDGTVITIEEGFKTDLSSVPQFLWWPLPPYGPFLLACLIHDWLYIHNQHKTNKHNKTQSWSDKEMLTWSKVLYDKKIDNYARLIGVRIGGKSWWNPRK